MTQLQIVFDRIRQNKKEYKELKSMYGDALKSSAEYQKVSDQLRELRDQKKQIEAKVKEEFSKELDKMEVLKNEIDNDGQVLSDIAMAKVTKGEKIEVKDEYECEYAPVFKVSFKRVD